MKVMKDAHIGMKTARYDVFLPADRACSLSVATWQCAVERSKLLARNVDDPSRPNFESIDLFSRRSLRRYQLRGVPFHLLRMGTFEVMFGIAGAHGSILICLSQALRKLLARACQGKY